MGKRKEFIGTVVSDKMQKTVVVRVTQISKHKKYSRVAKGFNKFKAHDEKGIAKTGDEVRIIETRPLSKDKHFRVAEVVKKAKAAGVEIAEEIK
jgi:small subunit ribosomal protein S17